MFEVSYFSPWKYAQESGEQTRTETVISGLVENHLKDPICLLPSCILFELGSLPLPAAVRRFDGCCRHCRHHFVFPPDFAVVFAALLFWGALAWTKRRSAVHWRRPIQRQGSQFGFLFFLLLFRRNWIFWLVFRFFSSLWFKQLRVWLSSTPPSTRTRHHCKGWSASKAYRSCSICFVVLE